MLFLPLLFQAPGPPLAAEIAPAPSASSTATTEGGESAQPPPAPGAAPSGPYPPGSYPAGAYPPGTYPAGAYPPGTYPPGAYPPGTYPPGSYPPGTYPPGTYPPGTYPPGTYPPGAYPPGSYPPRTRPAQPGSSAAPPPKPPEREEVEWFVRLELGGGTAGFSEENSLLRQEGYGGGKFWVSMDGAYMLHRHIGLGLFVGMNRRRVQPEGSPALEEVAFFVAAEAPILLVGSRDLALHLTPRLGYAAGSLEFDTSDEEFMQITWPSSGVQDEGGEYQHTAVVGGALSLQSFTYHFGGSVGLLMAPVGPPGETGRHHDYGGLYFTLGGTIDG